MIQVKRTKRYDLFEYVRGNRPLGPRVKKMVNAIKKKNMLREFPILVSHPDKRTGRMGIFDGQTRFEAAKRLGLEVYYVNTDKMTIADVSSANAAQSPWNAKDYVASFSDQGNRHYQTLGKFSEEFGVPITTAAGLLAGKLTAGGHIMESVKGGTFEVEALDEARRVGQIIQNIKSVIPFATDRSMADAIVKAVRLPGFDPNRLVRKIRAFPSKLQKYSSWTQYLESLETVYNYHVRPSEMMPVVIEVKKMARAGGEEE